VCGVQRSGTTLLIKMLSRNENVKFFPQESHLYPLLWKPGNQLNQFDNVEELANFLQKRWPEVNYGWTKAQDHLDEICNDIRTLPKMPRNVAGLMRVLLYRWPQKHAFQGITGEKTPAHIYYALKTLKEFPECRVFTMSRDPRAAALSEQIKLKTNPRVKRRFNPFNFIVRWSTAMDLIKRLNKRKNVHFVKYEDLILNPEKSVRKVSEFLELDYSEDMLNVGVINSSFGDKNQTNISFNHDNLTRWETELPSSTIGLIEELLGDQMLELGYELTSTSGKFARPSQTAKLKLARQAAKRFPARFHHMNRNQKYRK